MWSDGQIIVFKQLWQLSTTGPVNASSVLWCGTVGSCNKILSFHIQTLYHIHQLGICLTAGLTKGTIPSIIHTVIACVYWWLIGLLSSKAMQVNRSYRVQSGPVARGRSWTGRCTQSCTGSCTQSCTGRSAALLLVQSQFPSVWQSCLHSSLSVYLLVSL